MSPSTLVRQKVVVRGRGGPDVLHVVREEVRSPRRGEARVRITRAGVAFGDVMRRRGILAPPGTFTPGYDIVGVVEALGPEVRSLEVGDRVVALMPGPGFGGYSTHALLKEQVLVPVPRALKDDTAIALGLNYITAEQLLHRVARLEKGKSVLVHGAAGGVGTAVLDLAQLAGVRTIGTASKGKHDHLRERGCEPIDYRSEDFVRRTHELTGDGADAVLDGLGGAHLLQSHRALSPSGMLVSYGISKTLSDGFWGVVKGNAIYLRLKTKTDGKRLRMYAITMSPGCSRAACRDDWAALMALASEGKLQPKVGAVVPLSEVREAHRLMDEAAVTGKVILDCSR